MEWDFIAAWFSTTIQLFALLTPPACLSAFLSATRSYDAARKRHTALSTGRAVFIMGMLLFFFGEHIFGIFGFTLDAFRIGAGALLFLSAVAIMKDAKPDASQEQMDGDISVVPLAMPIALGPASIGTLMVLGAAATSVADRLIGALALLTASMLIAGMLYMADHVQNILGRTGLAILSKLTGLLLAAIAAQVVFTGIRHFLVTGS